jgi:hypothetical protein
VGPRTILIGMALVIAIGAMLWLLGSEKGEG